LRGATGRCRARANRGGTHGEAARSNSAAARRGLTGSYDAESKVLYWAVGNPYPDTDGSERLGDNLFTNCILALDPATGKHLWYFQFTPHDLHDWDASSPWLLVDATWQGRQRKLLLHADRNGFFYVLDRTNGELLLAKAFAQKISWASGIDAKGRPIELPGNVPTAEERAPARTYAARPTGWPPRTTRPPASTT